MLRTNVDRKPCPKQIELSVCNFEIAVSKRSLKLLQYFIERSMIIDQLLADLCHVYPVSAIFQLRSLWKQDVVFQMNVLVQIFLQTFQRLI